MTETPNERFKRLAKEFYRETGMMAPGKDCPPELGGESYEIRYEAWRDWLAKKQK